jgi:putative two-component system protein, hydrogenase maturation factor HypX/HoxX
LLRGRRAEFQDRIRFLARGLASDSRLGDRLDAKRRRRARDERAKPLQAYRAEEMARAHECFFGPDRSYHEARRRFTRKLGAAETTSAYASFRLAA